MHVLASIIDPANNGFDISDLLSIFAVVGAVVASLAALWRWIIEPHIGKQIAEATRPIQPEANGGKSLPDLHSKVDVLIARQQDIAERLDSHIEWHLDSKEK